MVASRNGSVTGLQRHPGDQRRHGLDQFRERLDLRIDLVGILRAIEFDGQGVGAALEFDQLRQPGVIGCGDDLQVAEFERFASAAGQCQPVQAIVRLLVIDPARHLGRSDNGRDTVDGEAVRIVTDYGDLDRAQLAIHGHHGLELRREDTTAGLAADGDQQLVRPVARLDAITVGQTPTGVVPAIAGGREIDLDLAEMQGAFALAPRPALRQGDTIQAAVGNDRNLAVQLDRLHARNALHVLANPDLEGPANLVGRLVSDLRLRCRGQRNQKCGSGGETLQRTHLKSPVR